MDSVETYRGPLSKTSLSFVTAGLGGCIGWVVVHPFNTLAIRINLASSSPGSARVSFFKYTSQAIKSEGILNLYSGLGAGLSRQIVYATSRLGLYESFRDEAAKYRETDFASRLVLGCISGGLAAAISCPAEVTLVRMSNDTTLPFAQRRNYKGVFDAFFRIFKDEGLKAFFNGLGPFVNRAMVVGAVQVGTYDQCRSTYRSMGITNETLNVFCASMSSGLVYSLATMPFESAKNRMAFQKVDPITNKKPYTGALQTITKIASDEGVLSLWKGFQPYYVRCGGHTVCMFIAMESLRTLYSSNFERKKLM